MTKWRDRGWVGRLDDVSDPRLAGTYQSIVNGDFYGDALIDVVTKATRIDNAEGSWLGHLTGYHETSGTSEGSGWHFQGALTGTGAYEGLTALIFLTPSAGTETSGWDVHGMVFPGEIPEAPEYPEPAE